MAYLVNQTRLHSLTINGVDYTASMVSWQASDSTANKAGLISTTGTLVLGQKPGGYDVEDYDRDNFKRGASVVLQVTYPSGTTERHPRGLLYVLATSYDPEANELSIDIGCRLALAKLTEDVNFLLGLVPVHLDATQRSYQNISAAFTSVGQYLYQDNQGNLISGVFFDGDSTESTAQGEWTSVLGVTALSAKPLAGTAPIPDEIELSYRIPADSIADDQSGKIDIEETTSYYYISYPATIYQREKPAGGLPDVRNTATSQPSTGSTSACGNTPPAPPEAIPIPSCNEGYTLVQTPQIIPALRKETRRTEYAGPAGQVSRIYTEVRGPALEANQQYFADKYAYCRNTWATACQPNGSCPLEGTQEIKLSYSEQINYYDRSNALVKTVVDTYVPTLSGAQPFNWRSGVVNGVAQNFQTLSLTTMYRTTSVITEYSYSENSTTQETTTYTSITARQSGISGNIDALAGVKTFVRRISTTISANPLVPDMVNSATTNTVDRTRKIRLFSGRYTTPPAESGPYVIKEQVPVPLLFTSAAQISAAVAAYSNHLERFIKGDAFGLQIAEAMREEICTNWYPGMPFRYYDSRKNKLLAMRMDSTAWGVDGEGSALVTNGIWIGYSNGTVTVPSNLVGDSRPDMGGGGTPPVGPGAPPSVGGETAVDNGAFAFDVDVFFGLDAPVDVIEAIIPAPASEEISLEQAFTCFVGGLVVTAGDLLATDSSGGIHQDYLGSLVTVNATIVQANIFG